GPGGEGTGSATGKGGRDADGADQGQSQETAGAASGFADVSGGAGAVIDSFFRLFTSWYCGGGYPPSLPRSFGIMELEKSCRQVFEFKGLVYKVFENQ